MGCHAGIRCCCNATSEGRKVCSAKSNSGSPSSLILCNTAAIWGCVVIVVVVVVVVVVVSRVLTVHERLVLGHKGLLLVM